MRFLERYCHVDTFCQAFLPHWDQIQRAQGQRVRRRVGQLAMSEIITILIPFHQARFRDVKTSYRVYVLSHVRAAFPHVVSYQRFVERMATAIGPLCA